MDLEINDTNFILLQKKLRAYGPWVFSIIIFIGYIIFIYIMSMKTNMEDKEWVKLTYVFNSFESIVFTAVGFIFGREVNRSRAIKAEKNEQKFKKEKDELAKEVLDKIPKSPVSLDNINQELNNLYSLRTKAKTYINN